MSTIHGISSLWFCDTDRAAIKAVFGNRLNWMRFCAIADDLRNEIFLRSI
jgi:hypothetical protein